MVIVVIIIIFSWKICDYESNSTKYTMLKRFNKWWDNWKESNNIIHEVVTCTVTMPCALVSLKWNALTMNNSIDEYSSHHDRWYIIWRTCIQQRTHTNLYIPPVNILFPDKWKWNKSVVQQCTWMNVQTSLHGRNFEKVLLFSINWKIKDTIGIMILLDE